MASTWQGKGKSAFQRDKTLDQKDYSMTAMAALKAAVETFGYELELAKLSSDVMYGVMNPPGANGDGDAVREGVSKRILELHELYFQLLINKVPGDIPAQLPGSTVVSVPQPAATESVPPRPAGSTDGSGGAGSPTVYQGGDPDITVTFGKYSGKTLRAIYAEDPSYIRWLAGNAREDSMKAAAQAVMQENGEVEDPYAA